MTDTLSGPAVIPASGAKPTSLVILLHGYGSNGDDLIGLVPYWRQALPDTLFVSPNAPQPLPGDLVARRLSGIKARRRVRLISRPSHPRRAALAALTKLIRASVKDVLADGDVTGA